MSQGYTIGKLKGECCLVFYDSAGRRVRYRLRTSDPSRAKALAPALYARLSRPAGKTVAELWQAFLAEKSDRAIATTMPFQWKALGPRFGSLAGDAITRADCLAYTADRIKSGIKESTVYTELGRLRMVLKWAEKREYIDRAPHIERPSSPKPREGHLTRDQVRALIDAAAVPHVKLFVILAMGTGARKEALLGLKWSRCDFERSQIDLRDPDMTMPHKGRAIVPMNRTVKAALLDAQQGAMSDYVIEWAGHRVLAVKRGLHTAAQAAGLDHVHPHLFRHSAAVHMAESGIPMEEIAQFLGHSNVNVTRKIYARFSPNHLRAAAAALEYDDLGSLNQRALSATGKKPL